MDQAGLDRSRVRILLCDKDAGTAQEVKDLLCRCSYQVSVVKTARQVVEVLNIADSKVDLVLAEVELPNGKGFKMLKHVVKTETFKHIPIVMMSARDEMAVVVKCLRLGAADYLVKPLRVNELLNLWTHMWRRRRMLGLTEKHIFNGHLASRNIIAEIFVSDTSESNTISLSEDSTDAIFKTKEPNLKTISEEQAEEASPELELSLTPTPNETKSPELKSVRTLSPPRRTELKLGQSSAFFSYAKVNRPAIARKPECASSEAPVRTDSPLPPKPASNHVAVKENEFGRTRVDCSWGNAAASERQQKHLQPEVHWSTTTTSQRHEVIGDRFPVMQICPSNDPRGHAVFNSSHLMPQLMLHPSTLLQPAIHYYHAVQAENVAALHSTPSAFSYYPIPMNVPSQPWTSTVAAAKGGPTAERKVGVREAALNKFRQKRKDRCFEKKIRYASRKRLAEQRPRIKGQFVRRAEDYEEEDDDDETVREISPESGVEVMQ